MDHFATSGLTNLVIVKASFSNPYIVSPTSHLILQSFRRFTCVTAHSTTLPLLHLRHLVSRPLLYVCAFVCLSFVCVCLCVFLCLFLCAGAYLRGWTNGTGPPPGAKINKIKSNMWTLPLSLLMLRPWLCRVAKVKEIHEKLKKCIYNLKNLQIFSLIMPYTLKSCFHYAKIL